MTVACCLVFFFFFLFPFFGFTSDDDRARDPLDDRAFDATARAAGRVGSDSGGRLAVAAFRQWCINGVTPGDISIPGGITSPAIAGKTLGVLLGGMCGDILGAPAEGSHMTAHQIEKKYGASGCRDFEAARHLGIRGIQPAGQYTDDTNSVLALATSLVGKKGLDPQDAAETYARFWACFEPERGYPDSAQTVMAAVAAGADIATIGRVAFPDGSFANGGAMRIAPVGIAFRNATDPQLRVAVENAIVSSHRHPEAIDGAVVMAKAVAFLMLHRPTAASFDDADALLQALLDVAHTDQMKRKLSMLKRHYGKPATWSSIVWTLAEDDETGRDAPGLEQNYHKKRSWFQIRATTAVGTSSMIYACSTTPWVTSLIIRSCVNGVFCVVFTFALTSNL